MKLSGKVALITGAGSGIGAATARLMADEGASIALVGIPAEGVQEVAAQLESAGHAALALPADVLEDAIPLGRLGRPEDIAPFITFLATPEAGYATGACIVIDGGLTVS